MAVEDIGVDDIQRLFNGMDTSRETKHMARRLLNQIFEAAADEGLLDKNPVNTSFQVSGSMSHAEEL